MKPFIFLSFGALFLSADSNALKIPFIRNGRSMKHNYFVGTLPKHEFKQLSAAGASSKGNGGESLGNVDNIRVSFLLMLLKAH